MLPLFVLSLFYRYIYSDCSNTWGEERIFESVPVLVDNFNSVFLNIIIQDCTHLPKIQELPYISRHQMDDLKQVPYHGNTL